MFQGGSTISLDAKWRLAIPTRFREGFLAQGDGRVVVTAHPHRCLLLYPAPLWTPIAKKIMAAPSFDPGTATIQDLMVGHADEVEMDSAGRILISPTLRRLSGIDREVLMFGLGDYFKLWQPEAWERQLGSHGQINPAAPPPGLEGLTL